MGGKERRERKARELREREERASLWREEFQGFGSCNIHTKGVLSNDDLSYALVHHKHPAITLLRSNADVTGVDVDSMQRVDEDFIKINKELFQVCCNTIQSKILGPIGV